MLISYITLLEKTLRPSRRLLNSCKVTLLIPIEKIRFWENYNLLHLKYFFITTLKIADFGVTRLSFLKPATHFLVWLGAGCCRYVYTTDIYLEIDLHNYVWYTFNYLYKYRYSCLGISSLQISGETINLALAVLIPSARATHIPA